MNKGGIIWTGYVMLLILLVISLLALIPIFKNTLNDSRGESSTLNCPGTPTFNQTNFDDDTASQRFIRRPTCFVSGMSMVIFVFFVVVAWIVWAYRKVVGR